MTTTPKPPHVLVVTEDEDGDQEYAIECPGVTEWCQQWEECSTCGSTTTAFEDVEGYHGTAHGVLHQRFSLGWLVPTGRCFVSLPGHMSYAVDDLVPLDAGRHLVDFDIEDESGVNLWLATEEGTR